MSSNFSNLSRRQRALRAVAFPAWVFVSFFVVQVILSLLLVGLQKIGVSFHAVNQNILNTVFAVLVYGLTILMVIGVPKLAHRASLSRQELGLARLPRWSDLLLAPAGFVVYAIVSSLIVAAAIHYIPGFETGQVQDTGFSQIHTNVELVLAFFTLVVLAPIAEETLFRGYLLGKLKRVLPVWGAILITSALFGIVHIAFSAQPDWPLALDVFLLSIMLSSLRQLSGSLWAPMLVHMIKNGIAFYILFLSPIISHTMGG